jgi:arylsulfatase A
MLRLRFLCGLGLVAPFAGAAPAAADRPNVVVVLADDLGYGDVSCYNPAAPFRTPHLDRLAAGGLLFTDAHTSASVCTPARYSLLTGRYAWRTRLQRHVLLQYDAPLIAADRLTLPRLLQQHGYRTAAIGKWHLGWDWSRAAPKAVPD